MALIAAAMVAFVLLVSLQALRDWPLAGIGGGDSAGVSAGRPVAPGTAAGVSAGVVARPARHGAAASRRGGWPNGSRAPGGRRGHLAATSPSSPAHLPDKSGPPGSSPTAGGGSAGSSPPAASNPGAGSGSGGGGGSGSQASGGSGTSTSGAVTGAVNGTVSGVDQATGGALSETGVTEVTEGIVNGVAGPKSTVGETVDKTVEAVG
jgi:hypothetical protein